jgi:FdhE protein
MAAQPGGDWLQRADAAVRRPRAARMRQGEVASKGAWIGNPLGGVQAPEALILPDPATRFARSAARLEALSAGHPMSEWLLFMAGLTKAQHVVATTLSRDS